MRNETRVPLKTVSPPQAFRVALKMVCQIHGLRPHGSTIPGFCLASPEERRGNLQLPVPKRHAPGRRTVFPVPTLKAGSRAAIAHALFLNIRDKPVERRLALAVDLHLGVQQAIPANPPVLAVIRGVALRQAGLEV